MKPRETRSSAPRPVRRRLLVPRGQAALEYSLISHALLLGGGVAMMPVIVKLFEALNAYLDSLYFVLSSGAV